MFNTNRRGIRKFPRCFGEKPAKNTKMGVYFGGCVNILLHPNFIYGPLLIASEGLTPIVVESIKFCEVSEGKQLKNTKNEG